MATFGPPLLQELMATFGPLLLLELMATFAPLLELLATFGPLLALSTICRTFGLLETIEIPLRILKLQFPEGLVKGEIEEDGEGEGEEKHADPSSENPWIESTD